SNDTKCKSLAWEDDGDKIRFEGVHYGYRRLKDSIIHKRRIVYDKRGGRWEIEDEISGGNSTPHELKWRLCMHPLIRVRVGKDGAIKGDGFSVSTLPSVEMRIEEGWYSKGYGSKESTQTVVFEKKRQVLPFNLTISIGRSS
ncbi:MAG: heparinase II/III family protein, partial [Thermodesulfobacteriota bacterium]